MRWLGHRSTDVCLELKGFCRAARNSTEMVDMNVTVNVTQVNVTNQSEGPRRLLLV